MRPTCLRFPYNYSTAGDGCVSVDDVRFLGGNTYVVSDVIPGIPRVTDLFIGPGIAELCGTSISVCISEGVKNVSQWFWDNARGCCENPYVNRTYNTRTPYD